jgi:hypothetical protein
VSTSFFLFLQLHRGRTRHELLKGSRLRHELATAASFATGLESAASQRQYASPRPLKLFGQAFGVKNICFGASLASSFVLVFGSPGVIVSFRVKVEFFHL